VEKKKGGNPERNGTSRRAYSPVPRRSDTNFSRSRNPTGAADRSPGAAAVCVGSLDDVEGKGGLIHQSEAFAAYCTDRSRIPNPMRVTGEEKPGKKDPG